jgi:hypothetical protein
MPEKKSEPDTTDPEVSTRQTHCPRLGGQVPFRYCLTPGHPEPCFRILDCWWQTFDVAGYLGKHLTPAAFDKLLEAKAQPNRLHSILQILDSLKREGGPT